MTTNPTMRIVWFAGRAFPVSSHPRGFDDPGTHWHVQTPDGDWHVIARRHAGENDNSQSWGHVMGAAQRWLSEHYVDAGNGADGRVP
jgi:hypothetical protein